MGCKIQFGKVEVISANKMILPVNIFHTSQKRNEKAGVSTNLPWDRIIAYGDGGPRMAYSEVSEVDAKRKWAAWKAKHHKEHAYNSPEEEAERFGHFKRSLRQIQELRVAHPDARFGLNEHSDSSPVEWLQRSMVMPSWVTSCIPCLHLGHCRLCTSVSNSMSCPRY